MKNLSIILLSCFFAVNAFAQRQGVRRLEGGFGKDFSATTTIQIHDFKQHQEPDVVTNGDFSSGTGWTTGGGWTIGGGLATNVASGAGTAVLSQELTLEQYEEYELIYTTASMGAGDQVTATLGDQSGGTVSSDGTYTNTFKARADTTLSFTAVTTNAGALTLDDVSVRPVKDDAVLYYAKFINDGTGTVNIAFNTTTNLMAQYFSDTAISLVSGENLEFIGDKMQMYRLKNFAYGTTSGTATLTVQGY